MGPATRAGDSLSHFHNACTNGEQQPVVFPHSRQKAGGDGGVAMLQHHDEFNTAKASFLNVPISSSRGQKRVLRLIESVLMQTKVKNVV